MGSSEGENRNVDIGYLAEQLTELKRAVRRANPILRAVAESRLYPILATVLGTILAALCLYLRSLSASGSLSEDSPKGWIWILLAAVMIAGGLFKIFLTKKIAGKYDDKGLLLIMRAIYGGKAAAVLGTMAVMLLALGYFLISRGASWYLVPAFAVFASFAGHTLDFLIDLPEYRVLGLTGLAAAVLSLFFIASDPWLWTAFDAFVIFGGFGLAGLLRSSRRRGE